MKKRKKRGNICVTHCRWMIVLDGLRLAQGEHGGRGNIGVCGNRKPCSIPAMMHERESDVEKFCSLRRLLHILVT